ncbi:MAG: glycosyltransferase [Candidatus Lokiarchaeota archaeon]|nr:glycosyltransferase [Candidatus Lokiarchaeota archaeon]
MDLVTFLITTFNSGIWLRRCISSILDQTYSNLQVIIIDDGSTDETELIISEFKDNRIEYYFKSHSGIPNSLNFGLTKINGKYIARIGADDFAESNRIQTQMDFLRNHPEYGIVGSNFILVDKNEEEILKVKYPEFHSDIIDQLPRKYCVWDGSALIRKELLIGVGGYSEERTTAEDLDLLLRMIGKAKFYNIQQYLTFKRVHTNNISNTKIASIDNDDVLINFNKRLLVGATDKKVVADCNFNMGYCYYYSENIKKSRIYFANAFRLFPLNLMFIKYYLAAKYFAPLILFLRKTRIIKFFTFFQYLDKNNKFFRNNF